jgi:hypothetical protein
MHLTSSIVFWKLHASGTVEKLQLHTDFNKQQKPLVFCYRIYYLAIYQNNRKLFLVFYDMEYTKNLSGTSCTFQYMT